MKPAYVDDLLELVNTAEKRLLSISLDIATAQPGPDKWSPKEIIGHLIDSAANNHQRFVRGQFQNDMVFQGYDQDLWVSSQRYADAPWEELIALWKLYNLHLARIMAAMPEDLRLRKHERHNLDKIAWATVPADRPTTPDYFMNDYVQHLRHHLQQIQGVLE